MYLLSIFFVYYLIVSYIVSFCPFLSQFEKIRDVRVYVVIAAYLFLEAGQVKWAHVPLYVLPLRGGRAYSPSAQRLKPGVSTMRTSLICMLLLGLLSPTEGRAESLVAAIQRQESGGNPLALNIAGKSVMPKTREEAEGSCAPW